MLKRVQSIMEEDTVSLLQYAVGPQEANIQKAIKFYGENKNAILYSYQEHGCIGIELMKENKARICHIAVSPNSRYQGIASVMIKKVIHMHELIYTEAETDNDAVGFYKKCGFTITSLGEKYPGVERFHCYWAES
ncbi:MULTISPECIES: GNAT family N-acetyltransferase [Bacillus cereus group]|uniref:N-acetyltransferase n=1 Tax=Bacillus cereus TaxID=1396 RepID=A0AA44QBI8_BACCE|nr:MULTISPECIES: GNAT family N-acetyltransferase [Bacillus cereus group]EEL50396.1 Acetyltransferase [Bacillus cereus Rock3-44]PFN00463.1 N-acetyltransferase [Bacillus cereus]PFO78889.1 N-acetyltransferase [Bacillus cereus]PFR19564.1 N-acetyltransferase [Bacillus cereus]PFS02121.1 N-acetyltransferase [Bacillus cereus]